MEISADDVTDEKLEWHRESHKDESEKGRPSNCSTHSLDSS